METNIRVDLRIMGEGFVGDDITKLLGVEPTEFWNKNDFINKTSKKRTYTAWIYSTNANESININTQLNKLMDLFFCKLPILKKIQDEYCLDISVDIVVIIEKGEVPSMCLQGKVLDFASILNARIDIDTYIN